MRRKPWPRDGVMVIALDGILNFDGFDNFARDWHRYPMEDGRNEPVVKLRKVKRD